MQRNTAPFLKDFMALEIERRFLVNKDLLPDLSTSLQLNIKQGYLTRPGTNAVVRVRTLQTERTTTAVLTIKTTVSSGVNNEFEYNIPYDDALAILSTTTNIISKTRYVIYNGDTDIELDIFDSPDGLIIAEIELDSLDKDIVLPNYLGKEITHIKGLSNFDLAYNPDKVIHIINELNPPVCR